jgi:2-polyprenyl-3-methyl-5-hydroxy-6-metoxy-1,4-benzoquinol methylase
MRLAAVCSVHLGLRVLGGLARVRRCVLVNQRPAKLPLPVDELAAVLLERGSICARGPELLPFADELADSLPQRFNVRLPVHDQQRVARTACRSHVEKPKEFTLFARWFPTAGCGCGDAGGSAEPSDPMAGRMQARFPDQQRARRAVRRTGKRLILPLTHGIGRTKGRNYFEDFVRVYPGGIAYNRLGLRRPARPDDLRNFRNHVRFYEFAAQFVDGSGVVDVGCGSGYGCRVLREAGAAHVHGTDVSSHALHFAQSRFSEYATFTRQSITDLSEYRDGLGDVVVSSEVLEHIREYGLERRALSELRRITRPGGLLVLGTPNAELLGDHGFRWDELATLVGDYFDDVCIFENALVPFEPESRSAWERRVATDATGVIVSQSIVLEEAVAPAGAPIELKQGLAPGRFEFAGRSVDTQLLHNTHSWVVLAVRE